MRFKVIPHQFKPWEYFIEGVPATKEEFDAAMPKKKLDRPPMLSGNAPCSWPLKMNSLGVHPSQVAEAMERNRKHGIHVEYDKHGTPIVPDRGTRRKLIALENTCLEGGVVDRSGGYGDDINTEKPPPRKKKLSQAFVEEGVRCNEEAMVKATRKKFYGKE